MRIKAIESCRVNSASRFDGSSHITWSSRRVLQALHRSPHLHSSFSNSHPPVKKEEQVQVLQVISIKQQSQATINSFRIPPYIVHLQSTYRHNNNKATQLHPHRSSLQRAPSQILNPRRRCSKYRNTCGSVVAVNSTTLNSPQTGVPSVSITDATSAATQTNLTANVKRKRSLHIMPSGFDAAECVKL